MGCEFLFDIFLIVGYGWWQWVGGREEMQQVWVERRKRWRKMREQEKKKNKEIIKKVYLMKCYKKIEPLILSVF